MSEQCDAAKKLRAVAAILAAERLQGWANPLVVDITDAADLLDPPPNHWRRWSPSNQSDHIGGR